MPAWKDQLTEDERWSVINYARATFGNPGDTASPSRTSGGAAVPSPSVSGTGQ
jgi:mono/diheme cytochrome c family protein